MHIEVRGLILVLLVCGCVDREDDEPGVPVIDAGCGDLAAVFDLAAPSPIELQVSLTPVADDVVVASAAVSTSGTSVVAEYGDTIAYNQTTSEYPVGADGHVVIPILGLSPDHVSHVRVTAFAAGRDPARSADLAVSTGPLPPNFPSFQVRTSSTEGGFFLVSIAFGGTGSYAWAIMIDRAGRPVWYRATAYSFRAFDFERLPNGRFATFQANPFRFEEVDLNGGIRRNWISPASLGTDGHELQLLADGDAVLLGVGSHTSDTSGYVDGGVRDASIVDTIVDELNADGGVAFHWSTESTVALDEVAPDIDLRGLAPVDAYHGNAVARANDGALLVSLRNTDTVYKIDRATGQILWRLGGKKSDFHFIDDPLGGFSHQHFVRQLANGDVLMMDNGNLHVPPVSRAAQYRLDESLSSTHPHKTATLVWSYRHDPDLYSGCCGSAQRLGNGNTVVAWGLDSIITETDPFGTVVWEVSAPQPLVIYRALFVPTLYP